MTKRIKITEEDFAVWSNMGEEQVPVIIKTQVKCDPKQLKAQILDDGKKIELLTKSELRDLPLLKIAGEQTLENKQLKEDKNTLSKILVEEVELGGKQRQEIDNLKQKLEQIEKLRLWIERDINAAKINKDKMAENMATCYNNTLKEILNLQEKN